MTQFPSPADEKMIGTCKVDLDLGYLKANFRWQHLQVYESTLMLQKCCIVVHGWRTQNPFRSIYRSVHGGRIPGIAMLAIQSSNESVSCWLQI